MADSRPKTMPECVCRECGRRTVLDVDLTNCKTESECWDEIIVAAPDAGWQVRRDESDNSLYTICPICIGAENVVRDGGPDPRLSPFDVRSPCPKCGNNRKMIRVYCTGSAACRAKVRYASDHIHRKCPACGFTWEVACRDVTARSTQKLLKPLATTMPPLVEGDI